MTTILLLVVLIGILLVLVYQLRNFDEKLNDINQMFFSLKEIFNESQLMLLKEIRRQGGDGDVHGTVLDLPIYIGKSTDTVIAKIQEMQIPKPLVAPLSKSPKGKK